MITAMGLAVALCMAADSTGAAGAEPAAGGARMELKSQAFAPGELIPSTYTCDGRDISPPLGWTDPPAGTRSLALVSDDPDAPMGTWVHWVIWNIPATARSLEENQPKNESLPSGARQGITDFRRIGYGGPCPPSGTHRYFFKLYALDTTLDLPSSATKKDLEKAMQGHTLAHVELMGKYRRR
jgi:Raf kinase inhibitor-like YbhB/YbcL family protein